MKNRLLFMLAVMLTILPSVAGAAELTWSFDWPKSATDKTSEGFYNFGSSAVDKDVYTATMNGVEWSASAVGTHRYAYTKTNGQYIGSAGEAPTSATLWTTGFVGKVKTVRISARVQKDTYAGTVAVSVNGQTYQCSGSDTASLTGKVAEYEFTTASGATPQEGKLQIDLKQTSEQRGPLYIKKLEVVYEQEASAVAAPVFSPKAGTYDAAQSVTISAAKGTIYYTTDGSNPRIDGGTRQQYAGPIAVAATTTLKAVAKDGDAYSDVAEAKYVIRKDPQLKFYKDSVAINSGDDGYADLLNPNKLSPITYKSSAWDVCSVDKDGILYSSYVKATQTVAITAAFAGNADYLPGTATMKVTVVARTPLKTPEVTPSGGTFTEPTQVKISTDDPNAVTIWYSTSVKSAEEFEESDTTQSVVVEGKEATLTIDKTCTLYVMTRGYNVNSEVVEAKFVINEPLKADFTTDKALKTVYAQGFDSADAMTDWSVGSGWKLANKGFGKIDASDATSISIGYNDGNGTSKLESPELTMGDGSKVEFYAYFQAPYLIYGKWTFNVIDQATGQSTTLLNAFNWAQDNAYTGPNWNKFSFDLAAYAGKKVKFQFLYPFGGEDLAIDGFRIAQTDPLAAEAILIFEGDSIAFTSTSKGDPESLKWEFPGGSPESSTAQSPTVKYNTAGTYDVTLTATRGQETATTTRKAMVVVAQKAPTALIGLPEEGYESPFVGVFVPLNVPVKFRDLSTGNPTAWSWVFQNTDVEKSTEQNPTVTFVKKGTVSVGLTAKNAAGQSNDILQYAIQAGGAQYVWNISSEENSNLQKIALGYYGNYAGSNWLGIDKYAERYQAPLADATIDSLNIYFASVTSINPSDEIKVTVNAVGANREPGEVLASASVKAGDLKYSDDDYLATSLKLDKTVKLAKGTPFFITVGPFPNGSMETSPYTSDDIAIFCLRRPVGQKTTTWQLVEDQDEKGNGLGTYKWYENTDDPVSMAIAPVVSYDGVATGVTDATMPKAEAVITDVYTIDGRRIAAPRKGEISIVRYSDGTCRKVIVR